jgi:hypothetical protein
MNRSSRRLFAHYCLRGSIFQIRPEDEKSQEFRRLLNRTRLEAVAEETEDITDNSPPRPSMTLLLVAMLLLCLGVSWQRKRSFFQKGLHKKHDFPKKTDMIESSGAFGSPKRNIIESDEFGSPKRTDIIESDAFGSGGRRKGRIGRLYG